MIVCIYSQSPTNQCNNPNATPYDSFLESSISYASFNGGNSSLRFRNPFHGLLLSEGTVMMWLRLPMASSIQ